MSPATEPAATVAVVVDGPPAPAWQARAVSRLAETDGVRVAEVRTVAGARRGWAWRAHWALERRLFGTGPDALAPAESMEGPAPGPPAELVVWLADAPPPPRERRDLLRLVHGPAAEPAERAFRRAVAAGAPVVETQVRLRRHGTETVVGTTVSGVRRYSATQQANLALWTAAELAADAVAGLPGSGVPVTPAERPSGAPGFGFLARSALRWGRALLTRLLFVRPWSVLVRPAGPAPTTGWDGPALPVRWAPGHAYADPCLLERAGRHHLFVEDVAPGTGRGVISHVELREDGVADRPEPVLAADHHLSYPFVFEHDGEVFLIPETAAARRVELFRAVGFPREWRREAVLLDGVEAVDATVLRHDGRFWLFVGIAPAGGSTLDRLHLLWAPSLTGPWTPHPGNPVVSEVRCARPAGAIQRWGSQLVRPGQDGSRRYGGAVSFRAIDVLTPTDYAEHEVARLEPGAVPGARATHTYARDSRFEAIDVRRREPRIRPGAWLRSNRVLRATVNAGTIARRHRRDALRRPLAVARFLVTTPELSNWTYDLANRDELLAQAARAVHVAHAELVAYADELERDTALRERLRAALRSRRDRSSAPRYGKRAIHYALIRALGPAVVAETGTHDGLGATVIARALRRNAQDGRPGRLLTFDVEPRSGWLLSEEDRALVTQYLGPTRDTLPGALREGVDLLIHDSRRTVENERFEYETALACARGASLVVLCDDMRTTGAFARWCEEHGAAPARLRERPARHWWPGNELGLVRLPIGGDAARP